VPVLVLTTLVACRSDDANPTLTALPLQPTGVLATATAAGSPTTANPESSGTVQSPSPIAFETETEVPSPPPPPTPPAPTAADATQPTATPAATATATARAQPELQEFPVPTGSRPHDVAPALDGGVWYTAQGSGELGWLNPATGETRHIPLGDGSAPHGVIVGPDGAPWITDGGLNAIVRVEPATGAVTVYPLPPERPNANLNTAAFDGSGMLWFTGQNGVYGRLNPVSGDMQVFDAPRGTGPYGITATPAGGIYFSSLAGSYIAEVNLETGEVTVLDPPTAGAGCRRVWSDSQGRLWVSEWNAGQLALYDPATATWREWRLPGDAPQAYAVYVDDRDIVWLSDFGANALVRFDPTTETFSQFILPSTPANVRQILGRPGEVWGAESGVDKLIVVRT
jgi:virginiamycin B lyase